MVEVEGAIEYRSVISDDNDNSAVEVDAANMEGRTMTEETEFLDLAAAIEK